MSEDQNVPTGDQPTNAGQPQTTGATAPAEKPAESQPDPEKTKPSKPVARTATSKKSNATGVLVSFILGVVVGVLAYAFVGKTSTPVEIQSGPNTEVVVKEAEGTEPSGEAFSGLLQDTLGVADEVSALLSEKNFGKAATKLEELSTLFERAKEASVDPQEETLMDDLITGTGTVQEAVNDLAEDSVKRASALRKKIKAAVDTVGQQ